MSVSFGDGLPTVLVVDDDTTNIAILAHVLEPEFDVIFATDGVQALGLAATAQPDVVLLDVMMPGMDGHEVLRRLRADPVTATLPVIFVTGLDGSDAETRGLEIGAADYVTKPFNAAVVCARVRNQIELKRTRDQLRRLASIDGLTGVANRRIFDETIEREYVRLARSGGTLGLILLDVDAFKAYNDRYGHVAGDECLRRVAMTLAARVPRSTDLVARYGGEEFGCILPETAAAGARSVAERLVAAVRALAIPHLGAEWGSTVSVSAGVATATWSGTGGSGTLIRAADESLYAAKAAGRDRVGASERPLPDVHLGGPD